MKPLIPLILVACFITTIAQTPKPTTSQVEAIRVLRAQVERLERGTEEAKKDNATLLEQERVAREAGATTRRSASLTDYSEYFSSPRHHYFPYRYHPRYYPRYYHRYYYPVPLYFPRSYIRPLRTYRRY